MSFQLILANEFDSNVMHHKKETNFTKITLTSTSTISAEPDTAVLRVGIVTDAENCKDASQNNSKISDEVVKAMKTLLEKTDTIQTENYEVSLKYSECQETVCPPPQIIGCEVSNTLTISTGNLKNVGSIMDEAINAGANEIDFISFVLSNSSKYESIAISRATQSAIRQAKTVAIKMGGTLVSILSIVEEQYQSPSPGLQFSKQVGTATSIQVGLVQISATVTIEALSQQKKVSKKK